MTLAAVETIVKALSKQLDAPTHLLPSFGVNYDAAQPEVRVDAKGYHFVVVERGRELQHKVFQQLEELLFEVFSAVTFSMALDYELQHRVKEQDFRIIMFAKQVELLAQLDENFAMRRRVEAERLLRKG